MTEIPVLWVRAAVFLATVIDIASRRVVGFALADHLRIELPAYALANKVAARDPAAGLIFCSDRGCQYTSAACARLARDRQVTCGWAARAECRDNAAPEPFFASLKGELIDTRAWPSPTDYESDHDGKLRK
jgi:transposase InsO family protein